MDIGPNGIVFRDGGETVVQMKGKGSLASLPGVICKNPNAPEEEQICEKRFSQKRVILPGDPEGLSALTGENMLVLGMTGYSSIKPEDCASWGIQPGAYEAACENLISHVIESLQKEFPRIRVAIADGASDMGVDRAIITAANRLRIRHVGFSCPAFMFYVVDDDATVYVAPSQAEYADAFIRSLHILISAGGRMQALEHDMLAAIKYNRRIILANVVKSISTNGGPPARDANGKVMDATAAFLESVISLIPRGAHSSDPFADLRCEMSRQAVRVARSYLTPAVAFAAS